MEQSQVIDFEQAILDPTSVFQHPNEVLDCEDLTKEQKIRILRCWEYDARQLEIAEEENMGGSDSDLLRRVLRALDKLEA